MTFKNDTAMDRWLSEHVDPKCVALARFWQRNFGHPLMLAMYAVVAGSVVLS